ncbi:hypothetical protein JOF53_004921 [Crossiella equi]|uniref:Uncharacterized protein n=1 Tax=Crossiella equi TaxID=130796 RepID=A0ABS5AIK8_9PSEU|nr:hypothetical protein [Crossiella equi]MBP2476049.1 hypothetical protein [Crossiella equi]
MRGRGDAPDHAGNHPQRSGHVRAANYTVVFGVLGLVGLVVATVYHSRNPTIAMILIPTCLVFTAGGVLGVLALRQPERRRFGRLVIAASMTTLAAPVVFALLQWLLWTE